MRLVGNNLVMLLYMSAFQESGYSDLLNASIGVSDTVNISSSLTLPFINPYSILQTDSASNVYGTTLSNGQILIGSTGTASAAAALIGTANSIIVSNGAGSIVLSTPQAIDTTSNVTFASVNCGSITDSGLTATALVGTNGSQQLQSLTPTTSTSCTLVVSGSRVYFDTPQSLTSQDSPAFQNLLLLTNTTNNFIQFQTRAGQGNVYHTDGVGTVMNDGVAGGYICCKTAVTTNHNTLDDGTGLLTAVNIVDSGLTASTLLSSNTSKQLQSVNINNTNGSNSSFSGSTLTFSNTQDIQTTASPSFANITDTGLTALSLLSSNASNQLQSVTLANANGCNNSFAGSVLTNTMTQNLATSGSPQFTSLIIQPSAATSIINLNTNGGGSILSHVDGVGGTWKDAVGGGYIRISNQVHTNNNTLDDGSGGLIALSIIDSGLTASSLMASDGSKKLQSITISNSNGSNASFTGTVLSLANSQDISSTANPTFGSITTLGKITAGDNVKLTGTTPQLVFQAGGGTGKVNTITATQPFFSQYVNIPDSGYVNTSFLLAGGTQTIVGSNTFTQSLNLNGASNQLILQPSSAGSTLSINSIQTSPNAVITIPDSAVTSNVMLTSATRMQTVTSQLTLNGYCAVNALFLPTVGGTPTILQYYEEFNYNTLIQGPWPSSISPVMTIQLTRIGRIVVCTSTNDVFQTASSASSITLVSTLPTRFAPSNNTVRLWNYCYVNGIGTKSRSDISSGGQITFYAGDGANFTAGNSGPFKFSFTWSV